MEEVGKALTELGFTDLMQHSPVASLSGGWKMKLALARAMLYKAQIMLLDEPTNHLDVKNVAWLENYLISLKDVTSVMVSHDSGFLDHVCQSIIHYEPNRKLRIYIVSPDIISPHSSLADLMLHGAVTGSCWLQAACSG